MKNLLARLTRNQRLAFVALALGLFALVAGDPYRGSIATLDAKELALIVQNELDHIAPAELADWIIQRKADYRLIDLREEMEFSQYSIPGAENVSLSSLGSYELTRNEKIVLYEDDGTHASQAWMLLRATGYKGAYILRGGLKGWKDEVLFPTLPAGAGREDSASFAKRSEVSRFFGGVPQSGSTPDIRTNPMLTLPKLDMPSAQAPQGGGKKKKKEGC